MRKNIEWFAEAMETRLKDTNYLEEEKNPTPEWFLNRLKIEMVELTSIIHADPLSTKKVVCHAADAANVLMMLANSLRKPAN